MRALASTTVLSGLGARVVVPSLAILALVGCSAPEQASDFQYRQTFNKRTSGLVLHEDGDGGHAGMWQTNCPFDTRTGMVTGDYDLPDSGEDIQDGEETELGEITLAAVIPGTVHVLDKTGGVYTHVPIEIPDVMEGRLTFDGVVGLSTDCRVTWVGLDGVQRAQIGLDRCQGDFEVDPDSGVGVVADPDATMLVDVDGATPVGIDGDLVAFDEATQAFYVAQTGEWEVHAFDLDGTPRWTAATDGPVWALDDAGKAEAAAVVIGRDGGRGAVAFYDGWTGVRTRYADTPSPAEDIAVSGNGKVIALVRPEQSFFFELVE